MFSDFSKAHEIYHKNYCLENITLKYDIMAQEGELDLKGLFYKLANAEQEGEDAVMDRKKITRALKVTLFSYEKYFQIKIKIGLTYQYIL